LVFNFLLNVTNDLKMAAFGEHVRINILYQQLSNKMRLAIDMSSSIKSYNYHIAEGFHPSCSRSHYHHHTATLCECSGETGWFLRILCSQKDSRD